MIYKVQLVFLIDRNTFTNCQSEEVLERYKSKLYLCCLRLITEFGAQTEKGSEDVRWSFKFYDSRKFKPDTSQKIFYDVKKQSLDKFQNELHKTSKNIQTRSQSCIDKSTTLCSDNKHHGEKNQNSNGSSNSIQASNMHSESSIQSSHSHSFILKKSLQEILLDYNWDGPDISSPVKNVNSAKSIIKNDKSRRTRNSLTSSRKENFKEDLNLVIVFMNVPRNATEVSSFIGKTATNKVLPGELFKSIFDPATLHGFKEERSLRLHIINTSRDVIESNFQGAFQTDLNKLNGGIHYLSNLVQDRYRREFDISKLTSRSDKGCNNFITRVEKSVVRTELGLAQNHWWNKKKFASRSRVPQRGPVLIWEDIEGLSFFQIPLDLLAVRGSSSKDWRNAHVKGVMRGNAMVLLGIGMSSSELYVCHAPDTQFPIILSILSEQNFILILEFENGGLAGLAPWVGGVACLVIFSCTSLVSPVSMKKRLREEKKLIVDKSMLSFVSSMIERTLKAAPEIQRKNSGTCSRRFHPQLLNAWYPSQEAHLETSPIRCQKSNNHQALFERLQKKYRPQMPRPLSGIQMPPPSLIDITQPAAAAAMPQVPSVLLNPKHNVSRAQNLVKKSKIVTAQMKVKELKAEEQEQQAASERKFIESQNRARKSVAIVSRTMKSVNNPKDKDELAETLIRLRDNAESFENSGDGLGADDIYATAQMIINLALMHIRTNFPDQPVESELRDVLLRGVLISAKEVSNDFMEEKQLHQFKLQSLLHLELLWVLGYSPNKSSTPSKTKLTSERENFGEQIVEQILKLLRMMSLKYNPSVVGEFLQQIVAPNYQESLGETLVDIFEELNQPLPSSLAELSNYEDLFSPLKSVPERLPSSPVNKSDITTDASALERPKGNAKPLARPLLKRETSNRQIVVPHVKRPIRRVNTVKDNHKPQDSSKKADAKNVRRNLFDLSGQKEKLKRSNTISVFGSSSTTQRTPKKSPSTQTKGSSKRKLSETRSSPRTPSRKRSSSTPTPKKAKILVPETPCRSAGTTFDRNRLRKSTGSTVIAESPDIKGDSRLNNSTRRSTSLTRRSSFYSGGLSRNFEKGKRQLRVSHFKNHVERKSSLPSKFEGDSSFIFSEIIQNNSEKKKNSAFKDSPIRERKFFQELSGNKRELDDEDEQLETHRPTSTAKRKISPSRENTPLKKVRRSLSLMTPVKNNDQEEKKTRSKNDSSNKIEAFKCTPNKGNFSKSKSFELSSSISESLSSDSPIKSLNLSCRISNEESVRLNNSKPSRNFARDRTKNSLEHLTPNKVKLSLMNEFVGTPTKSKNDSECHSPLYKTPEKSVPFPYGSNSSCSFTGFKTDEMSDTPALLGFLKNNQLACLTPSKRVQFNFDPASNLKANSPKTSLTPKSILKTPHKTPSKIELESVTPKKPDVSVNFIKNSPSKRQLRSSKSFRLCSNNSTKSSFANSLKKESSFPSKIITDIFQNSAPSQFEALLHSPITSFKIKKQLLNKEDEGKVFLSPSKSTAYQNSPVKLRPKSKLVNVDYKNLLHSPQKYLLNSDTEFEMVSPKKSLSKVKTGLVVHEEKRDIYLAEVGISFEDDGHITEPPLDQVDLYVDEEMLGKVSQLESENSIKSVQMEGVTGKIPHSEKQELVSQSLDSVIKDGGPTSGSYNLSEIPDDETKSKCKDLMQEDLNLMASILQDFEQTKLYEDAIVCQNIDAFPFKSFHRDSDSGISLSNLQDESLEANEIMKMSSSLDETCIKDDISKIINSLSSPLKPRNVETSSNEIATTSFQDNGTGPSPENRLDISLVDGNPIEEVVFDDSTVVPPSDEEEEKEEKTRNDIGVPCFEATLPGMTLEEKENDDLKLYDGLDNSISPEIPLGVFSNKLGKSPKTSKRRLFDCEDFLKENESKTNNDFERSDNMCEVKEVDVSIEQKPLNMGENFNSGTQEIRAHNEGSEYSLTGNDLSNDAQCPVQDVMSELPYGPDEILENENIIVSESGSLLTNSEENRAPEECLLQTNSSYKEYSRSDLYEQNEKLIAADILSDHYRDDLNLIANIAQNSDAINCEPNDNVESHEVKSHASNLTPNKTCPSEGPAVNSSPTVSCAHVPHTVCSEDSDLATIVCCSPVKNQSRKSLLQEPKTYDDKKPENCLIGNSEVDTFKKVVANSSAEGEGKYLSLKENISQLNEACSPCNAIDHEHGLDSYLEMKDNFQIAEEQYPYAVTSIPDYLKDDSIPQDIASTISDTLERKLSILDTVTETSVTSDGVLYRLDIAAKASDTAKDYYGTYDTINLSSDYSKSDLNLPNILHGDLDTQKAVNKASDSSNSDVSVQEIAIKSSDSSNSVVNIQDIKKSDGSNINKNIEKIVIQTSGSSNSDRNIQNITKISNSSNNDVQIQDTVTKTSDSFKNDVNIEEIVIKTQDSSNSDANMQDIMKTSDSSNSDVNMQDIFIKASSSSNNDGSIEEITIQTSDSSNSCKNIQNIIKTSKSDVQTQVINIKTSDSSNSGVSVKETVIKKSNSSDSDANIQYIVIQTSDSSNSDAKDINIKESDTPEIKSNTRNAVASASDIASGDLSSQDIVIKASNSLKCDLNIQNPGIKMSDASKEYFNTFNFITKNSDYSEGNLCTEDRIVEWSTKSEVDLSTQDLIDEEFNNSNVDIRNIFHHETGAVSTDHERSSSEMGNVNDLDDSFVDIETCSRESVDTLNDPTVSSNSIQSSEHKVIVPEIQLNRESPSSKSSTELKNRLPFGNNVQKCTPKKSRLSVSLLSSPYVIQEIECCEERSPGLNEKNLTVTPRRSVRKRRQTILFESPLDNVRHMNSDQESLKSPILSSRKKRGTKRKLAKQFNQDATTQVIDSSCVIAENYENRSNHSGSKLQKKCSLDSSFSPLDEKETDSALWNRSAFSDSFEIVSPKATIPQVEENTTTNPAEQKTPIVIRIRRKRRKNKQENLRDASEEKLLSKPKRLSKIKALQSIENDKVLSMYDQDDDKIFSG